MAKEDALQLNGRIIDISKGGTFKVKLDDNDMEVLCTVNGKIRMAHIKLVRGDSVIVELSPYDLTKGRIIWRN